MYTRLTKDKMLFIGYNENDQFLFLITSEVKQSDNFHL